MEIRLVEVPDKEEKHIKDRYFDQYSITSGRWLGSRRLTSEELIIWMKREKNASVG